VILAFIKQRNKLIIKVSYEMFKKVAKLIGAIALTGWMGVANATLIFDFSLGGSGNETIGEITGLVNDASDQSASSIRFTKLDGNIVDLEFISVNTVVNTHLFNVYNNMISYYALDMSFQNPHNILENYWLSSALCTSPVNCSNDGFEVQIYNWYTGDISNIQNSYPIFLKREVSVSEPGTVILLSLGLAGLSFARYRKQY
jgi:hypothetical protein